MNKDVFNLKERSFLFNIGFGDCPGLFDFGFPESRKDLDNTGLYSIFGRKNIVSCNVENMDIWCKTHLVYPDFIKIDVEGSEYRILSSSMTCLSKARYVIYEDNKTFSETRLVPGILRDLGYSEVTKMRRKNDVFWERST
jgi:FkbM family methyltransferase